ncbi:hypothetical protein EMIHUDRAFT_314175 [Emiliania huxleyi CCMP1516]|uniref:Uncharacterized protein n=2 Tax=Emiliania huxleyi TaxID=2903 RepID=A0A0D3K9Z0_EMIH1|nr:hypothetical protein EMIHUDRAFT_314175 [Emiliania huxleyi CCMP1516]EOD32575.1 hypothetical protein EMIHUDRAFT_314175 [Emiliania huxleyi CCMP1516]|eukprot:XP_005785004.1 hypothetical protein EMIHUDRAFT_314175 [Emiliania huxleyi CCMP1516]
MARRPLAAKGVALPPPSPPPLGRAPTSAPSSPVPSPPLPSASLRRSLCLPESAHRPGTGRALD